MFTIDTMDEIKTKFQIKSATFRSPAHVPCGTLAASTRFWDAKYKYLKNQKLYSEI